MKISVIIGVVHMTAGVLLKGANAIYFKSWMDFVFEFVPQLGFILLLFGYMDFLIIYKWNVNWGLYPANAPSIITTMINLPLNLGRTVDLHFNSARLLWRTTDVGILRNNKPKYYPISVFNSVPHMRSFNAPSEAPLLDILLWPPSPILSRT